MPADDATDPSDPSAQAEAEYLELQATEHADPGAPDTFPSGDTVRADRRDARSDHRPDRPPTEEEEAAAPDSVDPSVREAYEEATERGAHVRGEGQIDPG